MTSRDLATGEVIVEGDLTTASVALDAGVRALDPSLAGDFIGMLVRSPLPQGSLVHEQSFQPSTGNSADTVVFGAALEAGEYPRVGLRPGDIVGMIEVSSSNSTGETLRPAGDLGEAEVVEVVRISGGTSLLISMRVPEEQKILVSQIAEERRLRLVLIEQIADTGTIEPLEPLTPADPLGAAELDDASEEAEADGS